MRFSPRSVRLLLLGPGECDKRGGQDRGGTRATDRCSCCPPVCVRSHNLRERPRAHMKQVNVLNPQLPLVGRGTRGRVDGGRGKARMCGGSSPKVSGRMRMGSKVVACLRFRRSWGMISGKWGKPRGRERVPVCGNGVAARIPAHALPCKRASCLAMTGIALISTDSARLAHDPWWLRCIGLSHVPHSAFPSHIVLLDHR